jgi:hypothetical protein
MEKTADEMLATQWSQAVDAEVLAALREFEQLQRRVHAGFLLVYEQVHTRNLTGGYDSTRAVAAESARISVVEARRRETHVELLQRSPEIREAANAGVIGADHLDVIVKTLAKFPLDVDQEHRVQAQVMLIDHARSLDARAMRYAARRVLAWLDRHSLEAREDVAAKPANELRVNKHRNGRVRVVGELEPEAGALLAGLLDPLAKPVPDDNGPDRRTPAERHGDAFVDLIHRCANSAAIPTDGGERPHLTLTMSLQELRDQIGLADLGGLADLSKLPAAAVRRIACDAKVTPMVLDGDSVPLDVGRTKRTVPPAIRRALTFRDGGCAFPSCDRPSQWTDAHHVVSWVDGGPTALENMTLLCRRHHTLVHQSGWEVRVRDGLPEFVPPGFIDPDRKPRRNQLHGASAPLRKAA